MGLYILFYQALGHVMQHMRALTCPWLYDTITFLGCVFNFKHEPEDQRVRWVAARQNVITVIIKNE